MFIDLRAQGVAMYPTSEALAFGERAVFPDQRLEDIAALA
jgi:hypothetical protein